MITNNFVTLSKAAEDDRVPYSIVWIRTLCKKGKIDCKKYGEGKGSIWFVDLQSLIDYCRLMEDLGTSKHVARK